MPSFPSTPAQEPAPAPPPAPRAASTPAAPAKSPATPPKSSGPSVFEAVTFPIGAGLLVGVIGSRFTDDRSTLTYLVLGTVGVTTLSMITAVGLRAIRDTPEESASNTVAVVPVPVVVSAGRDNAGIAAGPGLFFRF
jgi:hypothetical protein